MTQIPRNDQIPMTQIPRNDQIPMTNADKFCPWSLGIGHYNCDKPRAVTMGLISAHERMANAKLRQAIALEAARLMYERVESEYFTAKRKAAKRLCRRGIKPEDLPSNAEIRDQIQLFARIHEGDKRDQHLRDMRLEALRLMRILRPFRPRLIGSVMTGHVRKGSDIDLHIFCDSPALVTDLPEQQGCQFDVERKQVLKHGE